MIADVPLPPMNPETTPEVVATYCLPAIIVADDAAADRTAVLKRYSVLPLLASVRLTRVSFDSICASGRA
jgi:hypothetical protein